MLLGYREFFMPALFSLTKKPSFFRATVILTDATGKTLGTFKSKLWALGASFWVLDAQGQQFAEVKGDWKGWNFRFLDAAGLELGIVTKKWAGIGKELLTSADNYVISLNEAAAKGTEQTALLLAAGLAIDLAFKER